MKKDEANQWLQYLCGLHNENGGGTEVRVLATVDDPEKGKPVKKPTSKVFPNGDVTFAALSNGYDKQPQFFDRANFYTTLNPVSTSVDKFPKDKDIVAYLWLPIDIDPIRYERDKFGVPQRIGFADLSSSDEELENSAKASAVVEQMIEAATGVKPTVSAVSGNGHHRLYRVSGEMDKLEPLVHEILKTLSDIFSYTPLKDHWVHIDTTVANPSRIWKLYGTTSRKGENTPDRPHRPSGVTMIREEIALKVPELKVLLQSLKDYLAPYKKEREKKEGENNTKTEKKDTSECRGSGWEKEFAGYDLMTLKVREALIAAGVKVNGTDESDDSKANRIWVDCPNSEQHTTVTTPTDACVFVPGIIDGNRSFATYHCSHHHCSHMSREFGAEYLHTKLLGLDVVKKFTEGSDPVEQAKLPESGEAFQPTRDGEIPKPIRVDRNKIRSTQWMLDPTTTRSREVLVPGLLFRGEVLTMSAPTKVGKTFQLMHAAIAWGNGQEFLGMKATRPLRILFIDPELLEDQAKLRLEVVAINTVTGRPSSNLEYINLRFDKIMGQPDPWGILMASLSEWLESGDDWDIIIVDSMYKFQGEMNLNDSAAVTRMLGKLKAVTGAGSQPAIIYVHHYAKGDPGLKKSTDRSAGSFAFSADADCIVTLTPHPLAQETGVDHYNVEYSLRHWPKRETTVVKRRADLPILDTVDATPAVDSAFLVKRRLAMEITMILEVMIQSRVSSVQPYNSVQVRVSEWRTAACKKLNVTPEAFAASCKIAQEEEWIKGEGAGVGRYYVLTPSGRAMVEEAKQSTGFSHIFEDKAPAPSGNAIEIQDEIPQELTA